jgi:tetratricopeptide (TPR) repeat protein
MGKTIALCMIVKNESKVIKRCIDSVRNIIDYWVIYDTGSTDNTKDIIAKELKDIPGELYESEFINFGYNRTELVQTARNKADYLLLLDADMVAIIGKNFNKDDLIYDQYTIRYLGNLDYGQRLLVKGTLDWSYVGVTHEYIFCNYARTSGELDNIKIRHLADGGSRSDKHIRDIKLLEEDLKKTPGNVRSMFYLAQSYRDNGQLKEARDMYLKRHRAGGWDEEAWYSLYQAGKLMMRLQQIDAGINTLMKAYDLRPHRVEPLYEIVLYMRHKKMYNMAYIIADTAIKIKYPERDMLFIRRDIHEYMLLFEYSIVSYYAGEYKKSYDACNKIINMDSVPVNIKNKTIENIKYSEIKLGIKNKDIERVLGIYNYKKEERAKYKSCAIVGNGPSGSMLSPIIDKSFVIRCNNYKLGKEYPLIGTKTDINVSSLNPTILDYGNRTDVLGILPISDHIYQPYTSAKHMHNYWLETANKFRQAGINVVTYGDQDEFAKVFEEVCKNINGFPSVGILAIALARYWGFKEITITGFTFFNANVATKTHYFSDKNVIPSLHHNYAGERALLRSWANNDKDITYNLDILTAKSILESDGGVIEDNSPYHNNKFMMITMFPAKYADLANDLINSANKFQVPLTAYKLSKIKTWKEALQHKPKIILDALEKYTDKDIVWLDPDATILESPDLFNNMKGNISFLTLDDKGGSIISKTICFKNNSWVKNFVKNWILEADRDKNNKDAAFRKMVKKNKDKNNICNLPAEYAFNGTADKADNTILVIKYSGKLKEIK